MNKPYFDLFRKKTNDTTCQKQNIAKMITESLGSTEILKGNNKYTVNLIIKDRIEGLEDGKMFCSIEDPLSVGDYFTWNGDPFLICYKERNVNLDDNLKKFKVRSCNVSFKVGNTTYKGVFIGSSAAKIRYGMEDDTDTNPILTDDSDAVLIFAAPGVKKFDSFLIGQDQWKIMAWDDTTNSPIVYATVTSVPNTITPETPVTPVIKYIAGIEYSFPTQDYYFSCDETELKVQRFKNEVKITMPYNKNALTFKTKSTGIVITNNITIGES